jgi:hypothetical protein
MFDQAAGKPKPEKTICPNEVPPPSNESCRPKGSHGALRLGHFLFRVSCVRPGRPSQRDNLSNRVIKLARRVYRQTARPKPDLCEAQPFEAEQRLAHSVTGSGNFVQVSPAKYKPLVFHECDSNGTSLLPFTRYGLELYSGLRGEMWTNTFSKCL